MKRFVILISILILVVTRTASTDLVDIPDSVSVSWNCINQYFESIRLKEKLELEFIKRIDIIEAIIAVESNGNELAFNVSELAAGILQIRPIMVREVNRLVGYKKYDLKDRWSRDKSISMFIDYQNHVNPEWDYELAAKKWNGGYYGERKLATHSYWMKVKYKLNNKVMDLDFKKKDVTPKEDIELIQQKEHEYKLIGSFSRRKGSKLFSFDPITSELSEVKVKYSDTIHCFLTNTGWKTVDFESQKVSVDSRSIHFEALNMNGALSRLSRYKNKMNLLCNLKPVKDGSIKLY